MWNMIDEESARYVETDRNPSDRDSRIAHEGRLLPGQRVLGRHPLVPTPLSAAVGPTWSRPHNPESDVEYDLKPRPGAPTRAPHGRAHGGGRRREDRGMRDTGRHDRSDTGTSARKGSVRAHPCFQNHHTGPHTRRGAGLRLRGPTLRSCVRGGLHTTCIVPSCHANSGESCDDMQAIMKLAHVTLARPKQHVESTRSPHTVPPRRAGRRPAGAHAPGLQPPPVPVIRNARSSFTPSHDSPKRPAVLDMLSGVGGVAAALVESCMCTY